MTENSIVQKTDKAKSKKKIVLIILLLGAIIGLAIDLWVYFRGQDTPADNPSSSNSASSRNLFNVHEKEASQ
jgi:flagellar basal body-associated protein FliL